MRQVRRAATPWLPAIVVVAVAASAPLAYAQQTGAGAPSAPAAPQDPKVKNQDGAADHTALALASVAALVTASAHTQRGPTVAAAANLNFALTDVAEQFARERGTRVELVFGASGTLVRQILDGAPFELFMSADEEFPNQLVKAGLTHNAGAVYATGRLALFAPKGSPLAVDGRLEGLASLVKKGGVSRFAIANPEVAPYGRAAEAVLRKRGLWDAIRSRVVLGDTIAQAAQFATTGNAVGGLIAYSLVLAPGFADRGAYAVIAEADHEPLRQRMVLLKKAQPVVVQFYDYVRSAAARAILRKHGYGVPQ
jgi:molybdate transport system substrate-binding protein